MSIPNFFLEISKYKNKNKIWTKFEKNFVYLKYIKENLDISFYNFFDNKLCVIGTPILNNKINNKYFASLFIKNKDKNKWLKKIDGEFVIIFLSKKKKIEIISSRFNFPTIWYYKDKNIFLASLNFFEIIFRLKELGLFKINENSLFELLFFRRVFGEKTTAANVKILPPASKLICNEKEIKKITYWNLNFIKKTTLSLDKSSDQLIHYLTNSLKKKMSDNNRFGLFLTGGMDTRLILACAKKNNLNLSTFTINSFINREVKIAKKAARITQNPHYFILNKKNHYKKSFPEAIYSTGAMYQPQCLFYDHGKYIKKYADVCLHGSGFDYIFQGKYLPSKKFKFFNKKLDLLIPVKIKNVIEHFLNNISYKTKGANVFNFIKKKNYNLMMEKLRYELVQIENVGKNFCNSKNDLYEFLICHNLARHWSHSDIIAMNSSIKVRTPLFDNNLFDFYQQLPWQYRFDSRIQRLSLQKLNPKLANLISSNTNMPIVYSSYKKTFFQSLNFLKRKIIKKEIKDDLFERSGLPIGYLYKNDWKEYVEDTIKSERLSQINFLDFYQIKKYLKKSKEEKDYKYDTFTMLLISINYFLKLIYEKK